MKLLKTVLVIILSVVLSGCEGAIGAAASARVSEKEVNRHVASLIDEQMEVISDYVDDPAVSRALSEGEITGEQVVSHMEIEENGREYLDFVYEVDTAHSREDACQVVESARDLVPEEEMEALEDRLEEERAVILENAEIEMRGMSPNQKRRFLKDLQKLVVKTVVLLTAGVVYACIPHAVWWGKVGAAAAVSVSAGVVAATLLSLYRYYQYGGDRDQAFREWLESVTVDPKADYMVASSIMALGATLNRSPVVTGIVICVFAIYDVIDGLRPIAKKYGLNLPAA